MRLGEQLVSRGLLSAAALEAAGDSSVELSESEFADRLLQEEAVDAEALMQIWSELTGVPATAAVEDSWLDPELVDDLALEWVRHEEVLPVRVDGRLRVLVVDPAAVGPLDDLRLVLGEEPDPLLVPRSELRRAIERCYFAREGDRGAVHEALAGVEGAVPAAASGDDLLRSSGDTPVTQLVNMILLEAIRGRSSDIHLEPYAERLRVRYRIDGVLYDQPAPPAHSSQAVVSRLKVMAGLDIAERRLPQDGAARVRIGDRELDVRVSTVPVGAGERVVLRLLQRESALLSMEELGLPQSVAAPLEDLIAASYGALWVSGPTGSGKTTTLYALLQQLDTKHRNIMTIEDPVEYALQDIGQISVQPKIGLTFARGLRHVLRQDPDVILVGETRDLETAEVAVRASLTGHLVFSTLHTNDAPSAITRLVDMGIAPYLLAAATRGFMAQRLVRTLCPRCRAAEPVRPEILKPFGSAAAPLAGKDLPRAVGCDACLEGYQGRTGLYELLQVDGEVAALIRRDPSPDGLRGLVRHDKRRTMIDDGLEKVAHGETTIDEILRVVDRRLLETAV